MAITIVGKPYIITKFGSEKYLDWIESLVEEGIKKFYILSEGYKKKTAKEILNRLKRIMNIEKHVVREYHTEEYPENLCIYIVIGTKK